MADNDQYNDEYQFADLDAVNPLDGDESENAAAISGQREGVAKTDSFLTTTKGKALIIVAAVVLVMILYKIIGFFGSDHKALKKINVPVVAVAPSPPPPVQPVIPAIPVQAPAPTPNVDVQVSQKLSAMELVQQNMRSDVTAVNTQLSGVSKNVDDMITKMTQLNEIITNLSKKLDAQSQEIEQLTIKRVAMKRVHPVVIKGPLYPKYYIQAVIPGRAWLIATNGATLTVREGTIIAGYGVVKLIDPTQGRVMTSSGQVIKFSQEDS